MRTTDEIRREILALVREYSQAERETTRPFHPERRPVPQNEMCVYRT